MLYPGSAVPRVLDEVGSHNSKPRSPEIAAPVLSPCVEPSVRAVKDGHTSIKP